MDRARHRLRGPLAAMGVALVAGACSETVADVPWCAVGDSDATVVVNGSSEHMMSLRAVWRVGGPNEQQHLSRPYDVAVRSDGWVAVTDMGLQDVLVLTSRGDWLGSAIPNGPGPLQLVLPGAVRWSEGGNLLVADPSGGKVLEVTVPNFDVIGRLDLKGEVAQRFQAARSLRQYVLGADAELVVRTWLERGSDTEGQGAAGLLLYDLFTGAPPDTLMEVDTHFRAGTGLAGYAPGFIQPQVGPGQTGALAIAGDIPQYRVRILGSDRTDSLVVCRTVDAFPLSDDEKAVFQEMAREEGEGSDSASVIAELGLAQEPLAVGRVFLGAQGRLWVQRERELPVGGYPKGATYDYFSPGGRYEGTVVAPEGARIFGEGADLVVGVYEDSRGFEWVVAWQLVEPF